MAVSVFYLNFQHGAGPALVAAAKQGAYTFLAAGLMACLTENLAVTLSTRWMSLALAAGVSSALAIGLPLLLHSARGTPEPLLSTVRLQYSQLLRLHRLAAPDTAENVPVSLGGASEKKGRVSSFHEDIDWCFPEPGLPALDSKF